MATMGDRRARDRSVGALIGLVAATLTITGALTAQAQSPKPMPPVANDCFAIGSGQGDGYLRTDGDTYAADATAARAERFWLKPTALSNRFLIQGSDGRLLTAAGHGVSAQSIPGRDAEWTVFASPTEPGVISHAHEFLTTTRGNGMRLASRHADDWRLTRSAGCSPYPEAGPGATGRPFTDTNPDDTVSGFIDAHLHITANLRAGGRVIHGEPFDRFGITEALGHDADDHGADGSLDVTGNLLRDGIPFGTHDTHGWPSFAGWPVNDTNTHQQIYYGWLQRAWMSGLRLVVAQAVEDEPICRIEPVRSHSCSETKTIRLEIDQLRDLEDYVDAQEGGRGRGWLRIVEGPREARRVIERGKLAVVIGVESSDPFGCSEPSDCTRADVDRGLARMRRLGVRSMFVAHWVDNAFAGAALEGGIKGTFINVFNQVETGHYFNTGPCPDPSQGEELDTLGPFEMQILSQFYPATAGIPPMPDYADGRQCNSQGLTGLGAYLIKRMIATGMLIDIDHMSELARERVLRITAARGYPVVSSHTGTGGSWTSAELVRLYRHGGIATATPAQAPELAQRLLSFRPYRDRRRYYGVGLGTDTGGFSSLPGPAGDAAAPLDYPFRSYDGAVEFTRQRTGERVFDLNSDGVAHYGLFADLIAQMQRGPDGPAAMRTLFRSAESYLQMWELAERR